MPSYTAKDLERRSGFDRRTIAYYVQEGLLPKVGRRGPRTRYPQLFLDRLQFIRRVREAEEEGEVPPVSLGEMRKLFERLPQSLIAQVADGRIAVTPELVSSPSTAVRLPAIPAAEVHEPPSALQADRFLESPREMRADVPRAYRRAKARLDRMAEEAEPRAARVTEELPAWVTEKAAWAAEEALDESALATVLAALQRGARSRAKRRESRAETWSKIRITADIELSVRGVAEEVEPLLERIRHLMRRMIRASGDQ